MKLETSFDPVAWFAGLVGTATLAWITLTGRKVAAHDVKIAVLEANYQHIKEGIEDIKEHLGVPRKE